MRRYKQENEELRTKIEESNNFVNKTVKELIKLATGYYKEVTEYHKVKRKKIHLDGTVEEHEDIVTKKHKEWVPGNIQAIKYLLNNRAMERWVNNPTKTLIDKELLELKRKEINSKYEWQGSSKKFQARLETSPLDCFVEETPQMKNLKGEKMKNFKKAVGYEYKTKKIIELKNQIIVDGEIKTLIEKKEIELKKYKKPSIAAQKKILKWEN